ncbi:hypothetical protein M514_08035 [Trichuris suis]|uniref:Kunitz/Bovine pancreatic trypsin inhibitor domain protein n=1 Tax=Trichuris suis TaxID=68888 RepID=A0A085M1N9_9BILA|nr:hypothetical protein M513_08035 [Trichuris suis]KFD60990.1 hypothetical protein M514_08035 [Trichuris suis]
MWVQILKLTIVLSVFSVASCLVVDPCQRQPFRATCDSLMHGRLMGRSQFVLRFYRRENECVSYPFALCRGDKSHAQLFKRKEDCELACLAKPTAKPLPPTSQPVNPYTKKFTSAHVFASMQTPSFKEVIVTTNLPSTGFPETASPTKLTKCQERRLLAQQSHRPTKGKVDIQTAVIYECTPDGAFEQVQCHHASGVCWCVNEDGYEIANTRTQGGNVRPDCSGRPLSTTATTKSWTTSTRKAPMVRCSNGAPAVDSVGRLLNCFIEQCPSGYRCAIQESEAVCCPDKESNSVASNLISPSNVCDLPKDRGSCSKFELRFYFNSEFKECKYFFYGGCGGNGNNFKELSQCEKTCGRSIDVKQPSSDKHVETSPANDIDEDKRCDQPKDAGPCAGRFIRWYWNRFTSSCEVFVYSGCKGSGNNFGSREQCVEMCGSKQVTTSTPEVTTPAIATQLTTAAKPRVSTVARISPVTVSTTTKATSSQKPLTTSPPVTVTMSSASTVKSTEVYEKKIERKEEKCKNEQCSLECIEITNSKGCIECMCPQTEVADGKPLVTKQPAGTLTTQLKTTTVVEGTTSAVPSSANNRSKALRPPSIEKCLLPLDVGPCNGPAQPRWGFNQATNRCERFDYTGCGGNMNHFYSLKECNILCAKHSNNVLTLSSYWQLFSLVVPRPYEANVVPTMLTPIVATDSTSAEKINEDVEPVCALPRDSGPCMNFVIKWFYNAVTGKCERFQYGSCGGNNNNFDSMEACNSRCVSGIQSVGIQVPDACAQEKDSGPCEGYNVRFYYNGRSMRCELFVYGGCGGNSNNFESKEACDETCPVYEKVWKQSLPSFGGQPFTRPTLSSSTVTPSTESKLTNAISAAKRPVFDLPEIDITDHSEQTVPTEPYSESSTILPVSYGEPGIEVSMVGSEQTPMCPNGLPSKVDSQGQVILCLPGKALCPPASSCYFNGIDFFCCPMEEMGALPLSPSSDRNSVDEHAAIDYGKRSKRQLPISTVELTAPSMLPNLPVVSPLRAPSLGTPYQIGSASQSIAQNYQRSQVVNGIFGPRSDYHYTIPQPPTLGVGFLGATGGRPDYCELPKNPGPCKGSHLRYYYDPGFDDCRLFYYGGCQGNRNNFGTAEVCRKECVRRAKIISCPGGLLPLGGKNNPITCGPTAGGINCPEGFFCQKGMFPLCCPLDGSTKDLPPGAPDLVPPPPKMMPPPFAIEPPPSPSSKGLMESIDRNEVAAVQMVPNEQTAMSSRLGLSQSRWTAFPKQKQYLLTPFVGEQPNVFLGSGKFHAETMKAQPLATAFVQDTRRLPQLRSEGSQLAVFVRPEQQLRAANPNVPANLLSSQSISAGFQQENGNIPPLCSFAPDQGRVCNGTEGQTRSRDFYYYDRTQRECIPLKYAGCGGNDNRFSSRNDCYRVCHRGLLPVGN